MAALIYSHTIPELHHGDVSSQGMTGSWLAYGQIDAIDPTRTSARAYGSVPKPF
jgi:hypothetical protein